MSKTIKRRKWAVGSNRWRRKNARAGWMGRKKVTPNRITKNKGDKE